MKRITQAAVATAALVGVSAFGVTALTGSTVTSSIASENAAFESRPDTMHKRWVLHETDAANVGGGYIANDVIRSRATGRIVGYDSGVAKRYPNQNRIVWQVAFAVDGGIIVARLNVNTNEEHHRGRILSGSGKYREIEGTMTSRRKADGDTLVTLHYRL